MTKKQLTHSQKTGAIAKMVKKMNELNGCEYYQKLGIHYMNLSFVHSNFVIGGVIMDTVYNTSLHQEYSNYMFSHIPLKIWKVYLAFVFDVSSNKIIQHKIHTFPDNDSFNLKDSDQYIEHLLPQIQNNEPILRHPGNCEISFNGINIITKELDDIYLDLTNPFNVKRAVGSEYGYHFNFNSNVHYNRGNLTTEEMEEVYTIIKEKNLHIQYYSRGHYACRCYSQGNVNFEDENHFKCDGCIFHERHYKKCNRCSGISGDSFYRKGKECNYCNYEKGKVHYTYTDYDIRDRIRFSTNSIAYLSHPNGGYSGGGFCLGGASGVLPAWTGKDLNILQLIISIQANLGFADRQSMSAYNAYKHRLPRSDLRSTHYREFTSHLLSQVKYNKEHSFSFYCYCEGCLNHKLRMYTSNTKYDDKFLDSKTYVISKERMQELFDDRAEHYTTSTRVKKLTQEVINTPPEYFQR